MKSDAADCPNETVFFPSMTASYFFIFLIGFLVIISDYIYYRNYFYFFRFLFTSGGVFLLLLLAPLLNAIASLLQLAPSSGRLSETCKLSRVMLLLLLAPLLINPCVVSYTSSPIGG